MGGGERGGTGREEMWRLGFEEKVGAAGRECTPGDSSGAAHAACLQREEEELELDHIRRRRVHGERCRVARPLDREQPARPLLPALLRARLPLNARVVGAERLLVARDVHRHLEREATYLHR